MSGPLLDAEALARLRGAAEALGLLRLGAVDLEHPGFRPAVAAYERFLAADKAGEMDFLVRTREVRSAPASMLPGARTLLVACVPYRGEAGPIARYAQSLDYHTEIHRRLEALAAALAREVPGATSLVCVDTKPVLERSAAMLAGLGFLGKHGCLIVPGLGSYVLLGALLTTAACEGSAGLAVDALPAAPWDACGSCRRCLDACPTAAFDGPGDLDPRRCVSYLTIEHRGPIDEALAAGIGERIAGCNACQEVCPYNLGLGREERVPASAWLPMPPGGARRVDPLVLAGIGNAQHRALGRRSALRRIPRRSLRRNALVALGNRPGPANAAEAAAITYCLADRDPQVVGAARRAAARRGVVAPDSVAVVGADPDGVDDEDDAPLE